jgi:catechol 2,3-dioxygenase-like lactoylglutathione lyase family enzyme
MDNENLVPRIAELGHVGLRCFDVQRQARFYQDMLGLTVTDFDGELGTWFLSARPAVEHHELLLTGGRNADADARLLQQISFRCERLEDVQAFHRRFVEAAIPIDMTVSHGNAVGLYFYDPEGNRCEVYWQTGLAARQPFVQPIDLATGAAELRGTVEAGAREFGQGGFVTDDYARRAQGRPEADAQAERPAP